MTGMSSTKYSLASPVFDLQSSMNVCTVLAAW